MSVIKFGKIGALCLMLAAMPLTMTASVTAAVAEDVDVSSAIDGVLVFPSGAEVTRTGKVTLKAGTHTLVLDDLPAQAVGNSIRVEGKATAGLAIGSVDSRRRTVGEDESAENAPKRKELEDQIQALEDERANIQGEIDAANAQGQLLRNLIGLPTKAPSPGSNSQGDSLKADDWTQFVALVGTGLRDVQSTITAAQGKLRETDLKINELRAQLNALAPKQRQVTEVKVFVTAAEDLEADLTIRYQVSNASWSPLYDARLKTGDASVPAAMTLTRRALVTQRSGEDWSDIAVRLSTTRPQSGSAAPVLRPLTVDFRPERKPSLGGQMSMSSDEAEMDQVMAEPRAAPMASNRFRGGVARQARKMAAKPVVARIVNAPFQAIFEVPGRTSVAGTGEAKRLQISEEKLSPTLMVRAVPKRQAKAYLYADMTMAEGAPLLTGPVSLFRDGVFVGTGKLPTLAGGEDHELGFGVDDRVRVTHTVRKKQRGETGLISSSRTDSRSFKISVKNLHTRPVSITILDQVPVASDEQIKVEMLGTQPSKRNVDDKRGVVSWVADVPANGEKIIDFGYRVSWPSDKKIRYR
ncbi:MAG: mucoidy inhibitor MuiA family protein [Pseudomonadota bacterium]